MQMGRQLDKLKIHGKLQMQCISYQGRCVYLCPCVSAFDKFVWKILEGVTVVRPGDILAARFSASLSRHQILGWTKTNKVVA